MLSCTKSVRKSTDGLPETPDLSGFPLFERVEIVPPVGELHWIVVRCSFDWKAERVGRKDSAYRWLGCFGSLEEAKAAAMRDAARFGGGCCCSL